MTDKSELEKLLRKIEQSPTECDGFVRLASFLLDNDNIPHQIFFGQITTEKGISTPPHFWVETERYIIDYRARMWLGDGAPHGVFDKDESLGYQGEAVTLTKINQQLFDIFRTPVLT